MALVLSVLACKLGHKWLRPSNIKAFSAATTGFILNKLPSRQGNNNKKNKDTSQEVLELATMPMLNNANPAAVVVPDAIPAPPELPAPAIIAQDNDFIDAPPNMVPTATVTVTRRYRKAKKPLQDYSLLASPEDRQTWLDFVKTDQKQFQALKACHDKMAWRNYY